MSRSCLVHVFGSGNVLAALSAVKWYGLQCYGDASADVVTLAHNPGLPDDAAQESALVVERIIASQGWPRPVVLTAGEMAEITRPGRWTPYQEILNRFRQKVSVAHFDEIYYTHDVVGRAAELAMNAYPRAVHITFGDALGSVYNKRYHLALASGAPQSQVNQQGVRTRLCPRRMLNALKTYLRQIILGEPQPFQASKAVLILPMDQTGDCLDDKELSIVPRQLVLDIISDCQQSLPELRSYSQKLLAGTPVPRFLMLLENISDGNFTSFEREVAMCEEMVRRHVPERATVFIKAHPLSVAPVDDALCSRLESDYTARTVSREFRRHPVELWSDLISACQVISMSYPSISLAYLYDKPVIYPVEPSLIKEYIPERFWDSYKNADMLYRGQLANLATWDGRSVLWKGSTP